MEEKLTEIKRTLIGGDADTAIMRLEELLKLPQGRSAQAYYILGNAYRKKGDWQGALNNYQEALALDPDSPAAEARNMVMDILNFYNKDMFNQ